MCTVVGVLMALMAATNPSRASFVQSIRQLTSRGLGHWAGTALLSWSSLLLMTWQEKVHGHSLHGLQKPPAH